MTTSGDLFEIRVYYEDTDFSRNVYHAAYLKFFERARTEWLRARGIHHSKLIEDGLAFAVRKMDISFDRSAHIDDLLEVETQVDDASGVRVTLMQTLRRKGEVLVTARVQVVMINAAGRPVRLPAGLV